MEIGILAALCLALRCLWRLAMILGIGADLCRVERIRRSLDRFGDDWLKEVFTEREQVGLRVSDDINVGAAVGFALKEACSKAVGTGFADGVGWRHFEVSFAPGRLKVRLLGVAARRASRLCPSGSRPRFQFEVATQAGWVLAIAVLFVGERPSISLPTMILPCESAQG